MSDYARAVSSSIEPASPQLLEHVPAWPTVPEALFDDDGPLPARKGTFTVLSDGGMDDQEILEWLFTPDASLPAPGAPIDNLRAGFKTEIRRRAMELAL